MSDGMNARDALALRREARRRKILENSTNRLKLIEGVVSSVSISSPEKKISERLEVRGVRSTESNELQNVPNGENSRQPEANSKLNDIFKYRGSLTQIPIFNLKDDDEEEEDEDIGEEERELRNWEENKRKSYIAVVFEKRLHYVFLACLVNLMFFFNVGFLIYENIFCPFYTIKIIEWLAGGQEKSEMQPMVLLLIAGLPQNVQRFIIIIFAVASALLSDLCIYMFSFVMGTKLINIQT